MDALHVTLSKHVPSIMKNGILRSKPILEKYDELMERNYGSEYDKDKGMVFGFPETINHRDVNGLHVVDYINYKPNDTNMAIEEYDKYFLEGGLVELSRIINQNVSIEYLN